MGKFGRMAKSAKAAEKDIVKDTKHLEPAVTDIAKGQTPQDIIQNSANVLDKSGDAEFSQGGKFSKLKGFAQNSMERHAYKNQMQQGIATPGMDLNGMMQRQMGGAMADMGAAGAVGAGMQKLGMMGTVMKGVEIVKDGTKMVTSLAKGDFKSMAGAAMELKSDFQNNGMNSMVDSVGMMHNAGMLNQVQPGTWQQMGQLDNGTMAARMGFNPAMAAQNPMIAQNAMAQQFTPGVGVPAGWGEPPKSGVASFAKKAALVGGLAFAGHELIQHHEGVEDGLSSLLKPMMGDSSDDLKAVGGAALDDAKILGGGLAKVTGLDALGDKIGGGFDKGVSGLTRAATGESLNFDEPKPGADPYAPPTHDEGPEL